MSDDEREQRNVELVTEYMEIAYDPERASADAVAHLCWTVIAADPTSAGLGRGLLVVFKLMRGLPVPPVSRGSARRDTDAVGVPAW